MVERQRASGAWKDWHDDEVPIRIGVSTCLLGQEVRHDGGHSRDRFVTDVLSQWVDFVPTCPEVEVGMGTPRPTLRLVDEGEGVRMIAPSSETDHTKEMTTFTKKRAAFLDRSGIDGYVLKKNSPSCGMERVRVYRGKALHHKRGRGLFAAGLMERVPGLPVEEDGRLNDPILRENFIERVFSRNRWRKFLGSRPTKGRLVEFHTAHKLILLAHDEGTYREMGRLVAAKTGGRATTALFAQYEELFQRALTKQATRRKHTNVLMHAMGHLKTLLDPREKQELLTAMEDYRTGLLPLIVPSTLLRFLIQKHEVEYLQGQLYFDPHPKEMMLRNHA